MRAKVGTVLLGTAAGALALGATGATAAPSPASFVATQDCQEHQAFIQGDGAAVAARLPERYRAETDPSGAPVLFVRALRCAALTLDGASAPVTMASYGIVIESPDGSGCASSAPGAGSIHGDVPPVCNWYTLAWLADGERVVDWLRRDTPSFPAFHTPGLTFQLGDFDAAQGGAPLHVEAPSPSRFTMDEVGRPRPGTLAVRGSYFNDTPAGTVRLRFSTPGLTSGDATGTVRAAVGSELNRIMGAAERPYLAGYSSVAAEHWEHASYRKQVESPDDQGFAGSCSFQGDASFQPPARNDDQDLRYEYTGSGTCTGTLNGAAIQEARVTVHHAGAARGGCQHADTTSPGEGAITFPGGTEVGYTLDFAFQGTDGDFEVYGNRAGKGAGHGSFVTPRTSPDITQRCAGEGVSQTPLDWSFSTQSPLVSSAAPTRPTSGKGPRAGGDPRRPRLRLTVRPRRVRAGRRTRFRFAVRNAEGRAVPGALIRLGRRLVRADSHGRATLVTTMHVHRRAPVRAKEPGFQTALAHVSVRRARRRP